MKALGWFCSLIVLFWNIQIFPSVEKKEIKDLKILHLTFHKGCVKELEGIAKKLSLQIETWFIPAMAPYSFDPASKGNDIYNIGHDRAERIWNFRKQDFEKFDVILTSDTAPLSRIFLQNNWEKPLLIWVCNRFDYCDEGSLDCDFPDLEYYSLFKDACQKNNVTVFAFTAFEHYYAKKKGINTGGMTIAPAALIIEGIKASAIPADVVKSESFFLPPYHNEMHYMDLSAFLKKIGIPNFCGRYNGVRDLVDFKGIIHIPYSWTTLAFFENISLGNPYFIPSRDFFNELAIRGNLFHPQLHLLLNEDLFDLSEFYSPENQDLFVYFDSWEDLKEKIQNTDYPALRKKNQEFSLRHQSIMLERWRKVFENAASKINEKNSTVN